VPPNRVYKLGGSAFGLLSWLDSGGRLADMPGMDRAKAAELERFFVELKAAYEGGLPPGGQGFGRVAYGFDFTRLPILGEIALTYRCNERCRFCYAAGGGADCGAGGPGTGGELGTEDWKRLIRVLKDDAKIPFFSFTGGEPLLRPDLEELASFARSLGFRLNLITNGSLATPSRAAALAAAGIDSAQVSLESPDPAIHDALCGVEGSWERGVAGIAALRAAGIAVQTNSTITRENRDSLLGLPRFLAGLGVARFSANLFIPSGRGLDAEELFVGYSQIGAIVDALRREAHRAGMTFFWYSPTPYCIYNPIARGLGNKSCAALDGLVHVNPMGEILPCSSWNEPLGKLLERSFPEIWFSERAAFFKNKRFAPEACASCGSFTACQGACPLYWSYAGEGELRSTHSASTSRIAPRNVPGGPS
jgi:radical SAM protein with 4Fe4S-binding SPASM domain